MTTPDSPENQGSSPETTPETTASITTHEPSAAEPVAHAPTPSEGGAAAAPAASEAPEGGDAIVAATEASAPHAGDADGGDDAEGGEEEGAEAGAGEATEGAATNPDGTPAKRKRRRRRKKKPAGAEGAVAGAEGATAEGAEGAAPVEGGGEGQPAGERRARQPKKERVERERPAFNVGDVVFGKVLEVTEDALFVDLSGKAKAIFDLRELLITEEEAEEYNRAHKADRHATANEAPESSTSVADAAAAGEPGEAAEGEQTASETVGETPAPEASLDAVPETPAAEAAAPVAFETPDAADANATDANADANANADATEATVAAAETQGDGDQDRTPQLPKVVLEPGAPFVGLVHNDGGRGGLVVLTHHPKRVSKTKPLIAEASRSGSLVFGLITGTIKGGVEVDVDGLRAFAPASHVELRPGADLSHLVGRRLTFAVTQYAKRGRDVVLSRRALLESEAKEKRGEALKNVKIGAVVDGVVRTVVPFGAFIDIGGVEGLVPLSEMSHNRADGPRDVFKVNDAVKVKILNVDEKGKLWLSRRAALEDPWAQVAQKYAPGTKHTGKIARLQPFGAFVELESGIDGLIHSADLSVKRIEHPEEVVKLGDEIEVVVSSVDSRQHRIALHPAPTGDAAAEEPQRIQLGKMVKVVVVATEAGGVVVRVRGATGRNARGFISASATGTPRGTELRKLFPTGKELEAKIVEMDPRRGEIKLSIKALAEETERNAYQQYRAQVKREAKFGTLADLLQKRNITPSK
ncbi:MAG: ribosomal protein S1p [Labilithrix sp.]|nr:ribosomal protein S1p [Labilithrix sp.]